MEKKEFKGLWWRPESPEKKIAGILNYTPSKKIHLELIGNFFDDNNDLFEVIQKVNKEDVIHGLTSDGTKITLFDNACRIACIRESSFSTMEYDAREIAVGIHLKSINDKYFFKAVVIIPELSYWLYPASIRHFFKDTENGHEFYLMINEQNEDEKCVATTEVRKGITISLCRNVSYHSGEYLFNPVLEQYTSLIINSQSELSMSDFYRLAVRFEQFMSLATMREVGFSDILLYSKEYFDKIGEEQIRYRRVSIDAVYHQYPCEKKIEMHKFLFDYKQIEEFYPHAIKQWYANDWKFDAIRSHFLDSIEYHSTFKYANFLTVIQAVEGIGNRYFRKEVDEYRKSLPEGTKSKKLHNILVVLYRKYSDVKSINQNVDLDAIVETRNYHSHLLAQRGKKWVDGFDLYDLTDELRKILICCILSYLGLPNSEIDKLTNDSQNSLFSN